MILRFEPLEGRALMAYSTSAALPNLVDAAFSVTPNADWNQTVQITGAILNNGNAPVPVGAIAAIYASPTQVIGPGSVLVGTVNITAGLQAGATQTYQQQIALPPSPLPGMGTTDKTLFLGVRLDPGSIIAESNKNDNEGVGMGIDQAVVTITADRPSNLLGTSFSVSAPNTTWGSTIQVAGQITNRAQGDAPATRAKIVLTPNGLTPGGTNDITVGSIDVPAIPAFQTVNVTGSITLPAIAPALLAGQGAYLISMIQDADHVASPIVQNATMQGLGLDTAVISIGANPAAPAAVPRPDLAATGVVTPSTALYWGQPFQVSTAVQNIGQGDAGPFKVEFLLTGTGGAVNQSIYLGSAEVAGVKAGFTQSIIQTLQLPSRLPYGYNISSATVGRIIAIVDPEYQIDEAVKTNNSAQSAPVTLRLFGSDGSTTVPVSPPVRTSQPAATPNVVATTVKHVVVPKKKGSYKIPVKHKTNVVKDILNYPSTIGTFIKNVVAPTKAKPKAKAKAKAAAKKK